MATKFDEWWRRASFPAKANAALGFGYEYWDLSLARYEGWQQLQGRNQTLGRKTTKRGLAYELSSHLLGDVLVAAGGVEVAVSRVRTAAAELQAYADMHNMKAAPGVPHGLAHPAATDLWYAFADLVSWTRTVVERLDRRAEDSKQFPRNAAEATGRRRGYTDVREGARRMVDLVGTKREQILRLARRHGVTGVRVFGSMARGDAGPQSDIDLLVEVGPDPSPWFPGGLVAELEELLGRRVQVITERGLDDLLRERVLEEAVPL